MEVPELCFVLLFLLLFPFPAAAETGLSEYYMAQNVVFLSENEVSIDGMICGYDPPADESAESVRLRNPPIAEDLKLRFDLGLTDRGLVYPMDPFAFLPDDLPTLQSVLVRTVDGGSFSSLLQYIWLVF